jgi:integrase
MVARQIQRYKGLGLVEEKTKTKRERIVPLLPHEVSLLEILFRHQTTVGKEKGRIISQEDYIFPNSVGKAMDPNFDRKWFKRLCADAGIPHYQRMQMRKTAFTDLSHVAGMELVAEYSGHTQISTLMNHYIDPEQEEIRAALQRRYEKRKGLNSSG